MPADANIYANLLRQPKSVQDYDALAMQSQSNMLALDEQRMRAAALKQAQADDIAYKNAAKGFGGDVEANYRTLISVGLPKHAADYQKAALEGREKQAKIDKEAGESLDAGIKRYRDQLSYIESPEAAARWYQAQYADPVVGKFLSGYGTIDQALKEIPSAPAAFKMWRDQIGMGLDAFNKKLQEDAKIAETGRHNKATEGIQIRGQNISASTARRGQDIAAQTAARGQDIADARAKAASSSSGNATEAERNAAGYLMRMQEATKLLDKYEGKGAATYSTEAAGGIPFFGSMARRAAMSPDQQLYRQAQEDWVRAKLRKESGASIASDEMEREIETYFPMPGDSKEVIEQKRKARLVANDAFRASAGRAAAAPAPAAQGGVIDFGSLK